MRKYDVTTLEGAMQFAHDFSRKSRHMEKQMLNRNKFEQEARIKRNLGYTDDEIWKGVKTW